MDICYRDDEIRNAVNAIIAQDWSDNKKSKYIQDNKELYDWVKANTPLLDEKYSITTRLVWIANNYNDFPVCETCGKKIVDKTNLSLKLGYYGASGHMYCCHRCAVSNAAAKTKRKKTYMQKYGVEHAMQANVVKQRCAETCI